MKQSKQITFQDKNQAAFRAWIDLVGQQEPANFMQAYRKHKTPFTLDEIRAAVNVYLIDQPERMPGYKPDIISEYWDDTELLIFYITSMLQESVNISLKLPAALVARVDALIKQNKFASRVEGCEILLAKSLKELPP